VYGQTGTGKTHTMGITDKINSYSEGVVPNTIKYLFDYIGENTSKFCKFRLHLSLYQVYMDNVHDLLNPENKSLNIREDKNDVYIEDLTEVHVKTLNQAFNILNAGLGFRKMGAQGYNVTSSRSHTLINIDIYQNIVNEDHIQSVSSRLTLVDLAGTERVRKTKAAGTRLKEARSINSSLSALGNVILGLSKGDFIAFRQSKLTRILQNSLKGDSKIVLLATVGSREEDTHETLSTLQFANRCKQVITNPEDKVSIESKLDTSNVNDKINEIEVHYQK
jgi:kinesin family protein 5